MYSEAGGFPPVFLLDSEGVIKQVKFKRLGVWARVVLQNLKLSHVWGRQKRLHIFFFFETIGLYLFNSLYTQDLNTLVKEDILWADMVIFIFWLEELRALKNFF